MTARRFRRFRSPERSTRVRRFEQVALRIAVRYAEHMLVCSCHAVFESTVRNTIAAGASCVDSIGEKCGAGRDCGTCVEHLEDLLAELDRSTESLDQSNAA